jgi:hypothetical protein
MQIFCRVRRISPLSWILLAFSLSLILSSVGLKTRTIRHQSIVSFIESIPTMLAIYNAALLLAASALVSAQNPCFNRDGSVASAYTQCPNSNFCCKKSVGGTCATNGMCMDANNLVNGSLALVNGAFFNQTGLYQSPACINKNFDGCNQNCLTSMFRIKLREANVACRNIALTQYF